MSDLKSKMPDLNEINSMAQKLFKDVKHSVGEIVEMYKQKRASESSTETSEKEVKSEKKETVLKEESDTIEDKKE